MSADIDHARPSQEDLVPASGGIDATDLQRRRERLRYLAEHGSIGDGGIVHEPRDKAVEFRGGQVTVYNSQTDLRLGREPITFKDPYF
jgi:hypothetical protein